MIDDESSEEIRVDRVPPIKWTFPIDRVRSPSGGTST
jgi:hypothetical protein